MKTRKNYSLIGKIDFVFTPAGYGHYRVQYTSRNTLCSWYTIVDDMSLIDAILHEEHPKKADLVRLKRLCKETGVKYDRYLNLIS